MAHLLKAPGAVDGGRLVQFRVDCRQGGQVDDRAPAGVLPDVGDNVDRRKPARLHEPRERLAAQGDDDAVHQAFALEEVDDHAGHDHHRDEVRQVADGLHHALEPGVAQLVEQQRQDDRHRKAEDDAVQRQQHGVANQLPGVGIGEELGKVPQADPLGAPDAERHLVVLEGDDDAVDRQVVEDQEVQERQQEDQVEIAVLAQHPRGALPRGVPGGGGQVLGRGRRGQVRHQCAHPRLPAALGQPRVRKRRGGGGRGAGGSDWRGSGRCCRRAATPRGTASAASAALLRSPRR